MGIDGIKKKSSPNSPESIADSGLEPKIPPEKAVNSLSEDAIIITESAKEKPIFPALDIAPLEYKKTPWKIGIAFIVVSLLFVLLSTVFARTTLVLRPALEVIQIQDVILTLDVSVSKTIPDKKIIPAELLQFSREIKEEFETSGRSFIEEKSQGKAKIYNRFSSSPQTLVDQTRFLTDSGKIFKIFGTVVVPGAQIKDGKIVPSFLEVELIAEKPGIEYNVEGKVVLTVPGFRGTPKHEGFFAEAGSGFIGGYRGEARVISKEDIKGASEKITAQLYRDLEGEVARKIPLDFKLIEPLREIEITSLDVPKEGMRFDKFSVLAKGNAKTLVFREDDIVQFIKEKVISDLVLKEVIKDSFKPKYQIKSADFKNGKSLMALQGEINAKQLLNVEDVFGLIKGKKEGSIIEILKKYPGLGSFELSFFPPWRTKAPDSLNKIRISVEN